MNLYKYDLIILDCDGVVFDSNNLKLIAYKDAVNGFDGNIVDAFIDYLKNNFGTSRYHLTRVFIEEFLKQKFDEYLYMKILEKYSRNCIELYEKSDLTEYLLEFLEIYKNKKIFVASGSDQRELRKVFENRNLAKDFVGIFGSPTKKNEIVRDIVDGNNSAVMIGDAKSDMQAANDNNIDFVFMSDYSTSEEMKKDKSLNSIKNLGDLI